MAPCSRRREFSDSSERLVSALTETITYDNAEDQVWIHNTHGQHLRIAELVAKGRPPGHSVTDSFEPMKIGFVAEGFEHERRIVKLTELI